MRYLSERVGKFMKEKKKKSLHGRNNHDGMNHIFSVISDEECERVVVEKESIYQRLVREGKHQLARGLTDLLNFSNEKGAPFTIATASGKFNVDFYFRYLKIGEYFDVKRVVYDNGKIPGKPNPDMYLKAMKLLDAKPENTIIFEDSYTGIEAAEGSGLLKSSSWIPITSLIQTTITPLSKTLTR